MKLQNYDALLCSKYRLSLMLFLFLNIAASIFFTIPVDPEVPLFWSMPALFIIVISLAFLSGYFFKLKVQLPLLSIMACIMGLLWAWQITWRFSWPFYYDYRFLLVVLMSTFFISAIALSDYFLVFCLYTIPVSLTALVLDRGEHFPVLFSTIALSLIGLSLQYLIRRRSNLFTKRLVYQLNEEKQTYSDLSMLDPLTGLYNRRGLKNRLENILENHSDSHFVLLLDIDHFKAYNDNYGHAMGDQALARVSVAIRDAVRSRDIVTRYGGEEFLVLMTNVNASIAMKLAERIRQYVLDLEIPHHFNERVSTHVTISAGIAPLYEDDFEQALANADRALYLAKNQGRNTILAYEDLPDSENIRPVDAI